MLAKMMNLFAQKAWRVLAIVIVFLLAGPEIMLGMELMAMVELLGASTFVAMYFSGLKLYLNRAKIYFYKFESPAFFIPSVSQIKQMPSLIIHAIPEKTFLGLYLCILVTFIGFFLATQWLPIL